MDGVDNMVGCCVDARTAFATTDPCMYSSLTSWAHAGLLMLPLVCRLSTAGTGLLHLRRRCYTANLPLSAQSKDVGWSARYFMLPDDIMYVIHL